MPDNDEHRNKRQCRQELTDLHTSTVADTPTAVGGPVLPSVPLSGVLSANPTRSAAAEARLSRARGLREWNPAGDCVGTDGGGDAEGEEDLSDSSNSMPSKASLALSSSDDECEDFSGNHSDEHGVIANGEPMEDISRLVGGDREAKNEAKNDPCTSFRRSTRVRRPNARLLDFELEIPASLVIQAVNELLEPTSVAEALSAPDAKQWIEALETETSGVSSGRETPKVKCVGTEHGSQLKDASKSSVSTSGKPTLPFQKLSQVRFILLLALFLGLLCRQVDFVIAFLNGPLDDVDIYMEQPDYFDDGTGRICKLQQSLYGLRQAPRIWYRMLDKYLRKCGFERSKMDAGVYV
ncbi:hypothetical protein PC129_g21634 [Phytophthora cactorum]|uniref:Reverse transcriptase Ty1/copia-type domain-containing protein n=1 Tax=Phytophthora cactorum TaxID=29920 RepID=A0A8T1H533_9STRA|nr:hypothetical protein PC129_g21634 [Phytophthora cactorum]